VAVVDDPLQPSSRAGRGFSHYFGLNDIVRSNSFTFLDTGLKAADPHGFTPGSTLSLRIQGQNGSHLADVTATVPAAPANSMADLIAALNTSVAGHGVFAMDGRGGVTFTSGTREKATLTVLNDQTAHTTSGLSAGNLLGIDPSVRAGRAQGFGVNRALVADPMRLALAQVDYDAAVGDRELVLGDTRGAQALSGAGEKAIRFDKAGEGALVDMALSRYAAEFGGAVGRKAELAAQRREGAEVLQREADARRSGVEGVNLDDELVKLTVYQQSFNASARLIQAAKDMYDSLLSMM
jgi:flagellar hook-associated protein 1 FlgK